VHPDEAAEGVVMDATQSELLSQVISDLARRWAEEICHPSDLSRGNRERSRVDVRDVLREYVAQSADQIEIKNIERLRIEPGESLVVRVTGGHKLDATTAERIKEVVSKAIGNDTKILVVDESIELVAVATWPKVVD
jgi:hypothetical protein